MKNTMMTAMTVALLATTAHAVPAQFTHQGRMLDTDGVGLEGAHDLDFILMDDEFTNAFLR